MSSERQVYVLYSVESSSRILLPKVFGQCTVKHGLITYRDNKRAKCHQPEVSVIIGPQFNIL
jgi:hypothetical protein